MPVALHACAVAIYKQPQHTLMPMPISMVMHQGGDIRKAMYAALIARGQRMMAYLGSME